MSTNSNRFMVSITPDMETELNKLKQKSFYNTSKSEMLRYLIRLGLDAVKENEEPKADMPEDKKNSVEKAG